MEGNGHPECPSSLDTVVGLAPMLCHTSQSLDLAAVPTSSKSTLRVYQVLVSILGAGDSAVIETDTSALWEPTCCAETNKSLKCRTGDMLNSTEKKNKGGGGGVSSGRFVTTNRCPEKLFEQKPEEDEGGSCVKSGRSVPGRENSMCKGPVVGVWEVKSRISPACWASAGASAPALSEVASHQGAERRDMS